MATEFPHRRLLELRSCKAVCFSEMKNPSGFFFKVEFNEPSPHFMGMVVLSLLFISIGLSQVMWQAGSSSSDAWFPRSSALAGSSSAALSGDEQVMASISKAMGTSADFSEHMAVQGWARGADGGWQPRGEPIQMPTAATSGRSPFGAPAAALALNHAGDVLAISADSPLGFLSFRFEEEGRQGRAGQQAQVPADGSRWPTPPAADSMTLPAYPYPCPWPCLLPPSP